MLTKPLKRALTVILIVGLLLSFSGFTDADLVAERLVKGNFFEMTTLSFGSLHTANFSKLPYLFNTSGFKPGGFDIKAVKIKKEGKMDFHYRISASLSPSPLCDAFNFKIFDQGFREKYSGKLKDLAFDSQIPETGEEIWILLLELPQNTPSSLQNQSCEFDLIFKTWRNNPQEQGGFYAERVLKNTLTSGAW